MVVEGGWGVGGGCRFEEDGGRRVTAGTRKLSREGRAEEELIVWSQSCEVHYILTKSVQRTN